MADSQLTGVFLEDSTRKRKKSKNCERCKKDKHKVRKAGRQLSWADGAEAPASTTRKNTKKTKKNKQKKHKKVKLNPAEGFPSPSQRGKHKGTLLDCLNESKLAPVPTQPGTCEDIRFAGCREIQTFPSVTAGPHFSQQQAKQSHIQKKTKERPVHKTGLDLWTHSRNAECTRVKKTSVGGEHREMARATASVTSCKERCSSNVVSHEVCCVDREAVCVPKMENDQEDTQGISGNSSSQDLFITQKTFLAAQDSSSEDSFSAVPTPIIKAWRPKVRAVVSAQALMEKATQTENFFSSEAMSVSWEFQRRHQESKCLEQPIDLSLPRKTGLEMPSEAEGEKSDCCLSAHRNTCVKNRRKEKNVLEKSKSNIGKGEMKAVQTKLNESFFFKVKGDGDSPKPQSPLMRLPDASVMK